MPTLRDLFCRAACRRFATSTHGVFGIQGLHAPHDWEILTKDAIKRITATKKKIFAAPPSSRVVRLLDDLSDEICRVLDSAKNCAISHADRDWRQAAMKAMLDMDGALAEVNLDGSLHASLAASLGRCRAAWRDTGLLQDNAYPLERALESAAPIARRMTALLDRGGPGGADCPTRHAPVPPADGRGAHRGETASASLSVALEYSEECVRVGKALLHDFEVSGVHLSPGEREHVHDLMLRRGQLRQAFLSGAASGVKRDLIVQASSERQAALSAAGCSTSRQEGMLRVAIPDQAGFRVLESSDDDALCEAVYKTVYSDSHPNASVLSQLVACSGELARTLGHRSYAHMNASSGQRLAGSPEAVRHFLRALSARNMPHASRSNAQLARAVGRADLPPWLALRARAHHASQEGLLEPRLELGQYLHVDRCIEGLLSLARRVTGVVLREVPMQTGESWAPPGLIRKVVVESGGATDGVLYLDLWARPHKHRVPNVQVLQCSRALDWRPGMTRADVLGARGQPPVLVLSCNYVARELGLSELKTLFHEFGHALHWLLSRTEFQHMSGTRSPPDFMEVASHLFEHFATDPRVLREFARHRDTGDPIPEDLLDKARKAMAVLPALRLQEDLLNSIVDQELFGMSDASDVTDVIADTMGQHSVTPLVPGTNPFIHFVHFCDYSSEYYGYLYAQALSAAIWEALFRDDPFEACAGAELARFLECGSSGDYQEQIRRLAGPNALMEVEGGFCPDPDFFLERVLNLKG